MQQLIAITIALVALTSPVWVIYSVIKFAQWQKRRQRSNEKMIQCTQCGAWVIESIKEQHICLGR